MDTNITGTPRRNVLCQTAMMMQVVSSNHVTPIGNALQAVSSVCVIQPLTVPNV